MTARFAAIAALILVTGAAPPKPFKLHQKSRDADFTYEWPVEVSATPALLQRFRADMRKQRAGVTKGGREYNAMRRKMGEGPVGYVHSTKITTAGQSRRLLSLRLDVYRFTGGAHGNNHSDGVLWDRQRGREIEMADLFLPGARYVTALITPYCKAIAAEREKRRGRDGRSGTSIREFDDCPALADTAFVPADRNRNGRFDRFHFIAAPYTAGPYSEGDYDIAIRIPARVLTMLKPEYRAAFEA